jgi:hypothetical protein
MPSISCMRSKFQQLANHFRLYKLTRALTMLVGIFAAIIGISGLLIDSLKIIWQVETLAVNVSLPLSALGVFGIYVARVERKRMTTCVSVLFTALTMCHLLFLFSITRRGTSVHIPFLDARYRNYDQGSTCWTGVIVYKDYDSNSVFPITDNCCEVMNDDNSTKLVCARCRHVYKCAEATFVSTHNEVIVTTGVVASCALLFAIVLKLSRVGGDSLPDVKRPTRWSEVTNFYDVPPPLPPMEPIYTQMLRNSRSAIRPDPH